MTAGIPIVATRAGGIPEMITDGVNGLLVRAADSQSLSSALQRLLSHPDLSRGIAQNAKELVASSYSTAARAQALTDIYLEVVRTCRPIRSRAAIAS